MLVGLPLAFLLWNRPLDFDFSLLKAKEYQYNLRKN